MKKYFLIGQLNLLLTLFFQAQLYAQPYSDRDGINNFERNAYLVTAYGLTENQLSQYNALLLAKATESHSFFDIPRQREEWKAGYVNFSTRLQKDVRDILSEEQYAKWSKDNRNSDQTRRYRENLNILDDSTLDKMLIAIEGCKKELKNINQQKVSEKERKDAQHVALTKRDNILKVLFGDKKGGELIKYIDLEDKAAFVRTNFPQFSYNLSYVVGQIYLDFTYATRAAEWSAKDEKTIADDKNKAHNKLLEEMKSSLTPTQYAMWSEYHNRYHNNHVKHTHDMTSEQFEIYKEIMNDRAMKRLVIGRSGVLGEAKQTRLDSLDATIYSTLREKISPHCADLWLKNTHPEK